MDAASTMVMPNASYVQGWMFSRVLLNTSTASSCKGYGMPLSGVSALQGREACSEPWHVATKLFWLSYD